MLEKGAIAGKMMGSLWFAYSKFRGDWQNLSVCKIWMIQTIFYSPSLCLNTFYIPEYSVAVEVADSLLQNLTRKTKWAVSNMGEHRNSCSPAPGSLCVVTTGQWSVPVLVTRPIVLGDQAPMGWPVPVSGLTIPSPHGDHWPPLPPALYATCHQDIEPKQNPLKGTYQEWLIRLRAAREWCRDRNGSRCHRWCHECDADAFSPKSGILLCVFDRALLCQLQTIGWESYPSEWEWCCTYYTISQNILL